MLSKEFISEYIHNNKSGKMSSEKFVLKNYTKDYDVINEYTKNLELPFKQRVYHCINRISVYVKCKKCDNLVNFKNSTLGYYNYCSNVCVGTDPEIKKKKESTNLERFGVEHASLNTQIKEKVKKMYDNRTGEYMNTIKKKRIKTLNDKYGVDNVAELKEVQTKRISTFKENIEEWKINYKMSSLERYGVEHPWMLGNIHKKTVDTSFDKRIIDAKNKVLQKLPDGYRFVDIYSDGTHRLISVIICPYNHEFNISNNLLYDRTVRNKTEVCTTCNPNNKGISGKEISLLNFIKENYDDDIVRNSREIIHPYELDVYIPALKLAFEFNGLYWHSELHKDKNYHYDKTKICEEMDIQLIHIWEDDWVFRHDIIKSMILNKLNKTNNRLYARKCEVRVIDDNKTVKAFLNDNHIQGFVGSKIKLGLYHNNELVSLMTFGEMRKMMGHVAKNNVYELMRFCNKRDTTVIGGASKLFKHFLNNYEYDKIYSYSDNSYSNGNLYENLGFKLDNVSDKLNYYWVVDKERHHRYNYRKDKLVKMGYDKNKSERDIMYEDVGSFRIWGSGNKKWVYE